MRAAFLLVMSFNCLSSVGVVLCAGIGGGAYLDGSNATLSDCRFERNSATGSDLFGQLASFGGGLATRGPLCLTNIR